MKMAWNVFYTVLLIAGICGICLTAVNSMTGWFNKALSGGGTVVCLMGFVVATVYSAKVLCKESGRAKQVQK